ncbi:coatomer subunit alpha-1-like, partial [Trifolium medium]|nr:coatomer subunit alpha-1-like [Trifolium medium]
MEDLELGPEANTPTASFGTQSSVFIPPTPGMPVSHIWMQKSSLAAEHAAAGNFDTAMSHSYLRAFSSAPIISLAVER